MTTLAALTQTTLNMLYGLTQVEHPKQDTINGAFTAGTLTMPVTTTNMWKRDDYAEFSDGELVICAADASGGNVTVRRGQRGTTDTTQSSGDVIVKNPPFPISDIQNAINEVIRNDLWPHVWTWHQGSFAYVAGDHMYDLPAYVTDVVMVYQYDLNNDDRFHPIPVGWWDTERQIDTTAATNSNLLRVVKVHDEDATVFYTAKRRPDTADLANASDEIADLIPWAAAAKVLAVRSPQTKLDSARNRHDEDGAHLRDYRGLMAEFLRMRAALNLQLRDEIRTEPRFRPRFRRRY